MPLHFLNHLNAIFEGHLEVKNHQRQWLNNLGVVCVRDCFVNDSLARVNRYLTVVTVGHIGYTKRVEEFFEHHDVDLGVVSDKDLLERACVQGSWLFIA
jgi:hypothetical protein